ncbi:QCR7 [Auxenochlorella protothecoides x Auxenochlorella symbiontica]|uniref:Cytochrome b-c1 complex subunit 7 n=1 Tax=Auxenochlorella protothecoides TaxID=3075 RepID=A0A1D1ZRR4_AUXPR
MAAKGAIAKLFDPLVARLAPAYQAAVGNELRKVGLRYEDLYDPEFDLDTAEALRRLSPDEVHARNQRLKRGMDMSMKHSELPHEIQEQQTPFNFYLDETLAQVKAENEERKQLGSGRPYDRHLP